MLSPLYYESCTEAILAQYARLEDAILSAMVRRILKMGFVSDSTKHQAEMLQEAGLLYDDILQIIADQTNATVEQVKALFEDAGVRTVEIDNEVYREAGMVPVDIRQSDSMRQTLEAGFR
ncbi:MAG: phage minor capsid protein, partial [Ruminococcus sp.]